jgi:hypothetical protein
MDLDREWTAFACDAEAETFGTVRMAKAHNRAIRERDALREWKALAVVVLAAIEADTTAKECSLCGTLGWYYRQRHAPDCALAALLREP